MYKFLGYPILNKVYFSEDVFSFMFYSYKKVMFPQKEFFAVFFAAWFPNTNNVYIFSKCLKFRFSYTVQYLASVFKSNLICTQSRAYLGSISSYFLDLIVYPDWYTSDRVLFCPLWQLFSRGKARVMPISLICLYPPPGADFSPYFSPKNLSMLPRPIH